MRPSSFDQVMRKYVEQHEVYDPALDEDKILHGEVESYFE
jgi:hypothetical protein